MVQLFRNRYTSLTGGIVMKGYVVTAGYMGYVNGGYMLFASEEDYLEYCE